MSRRKSNNTQPSLFPFLAVLVSTMGALIFLLLVISRQAQLQRNQAAEQKAQMQPAPTELEPLQLPPLPEVPALQEYPSVEPLPPLALTPIEEGPLPELPPVVDPLPELAERKSLLKQKLAALREKLGAPLAEKQRLAEVQNQLKQIQIRFEKLQAELTRRAIALADVEVDLERLQNELLRRRREANAISNKYSIVAYEGGYGTNRRPIFLECVEDKIILQPEGVALVAEQIGNPDFPGNGLAIVVEALMFELKKTGEGEPYPLFVVRPEGIPTFQVAWYALQSLDLRFGYELVDSDIELAYPPVDPAIREAAIRVLKDSTGYAFVRSDGFGWQMAGRESLPGLGLPSSGMGGSEENALTKYSSIFGTAAGGQDSTSFRPGADAVAAGDDGTDASGPTTTPNLIARAGDLPRRLFGQGAGTGNGSDIAGDVPGAGSSKEPGAQATGDGGSLSAPTFGTGGPGSASASNTVASGTMEPSAGGVKEPVTGSSQRGESGPVFPESSAGQNAASSSNSLLRLGSAGQVPQTGEPNPLSLSLGLPEQSRSRGEQSKEGPVLDLDTFSTADASSGTPLRAKDKVVDTQASRAGAIRFLARPVRREIPIECQGNKVVLFGEQETFPVTVGDDPDAAAREILVHAGRVARQWGDAGDRARWEPVLVFHVRPDGLGTYYQLRSSLLVSRIAIERKLIDWTAMVHESQLLQGGW